MPALEEGEARHRFAGARVARLATVGGDGGPHLVPVVFALEGDTVAMAVDNKPKRSTRLRRLENIRANPSVSLLVDHYEEDWDRLWWVRADGRARTARPSGPGDLAGPGDPADARAAALDLLREKYPQYGAAPPEGPVIWIAVRRWRGWEASTPEA